MPYTYRYNEFNGNYEIIENILGHKRVIRLCDNELEAKLLIKHYVSNYKRLTKEFLRIEEEI